MDNLSISIRALLAQSGKSTSFVNWGSVVQIHHGAPITIISRASAILRGGRYLHDQPSEAFEKGEGRKGKP